MSRSSPAYFAGLEFAPIFSVEIVIPRISPRLAQRANVAASNPCVYFRQGICIPVLDHFILHLSSRLSTLITLVHSSLLPGGFLNQRFQILRHFYISINLDSICPFLSFKVSSSYGNRSALISPMTQLKFFQPVQSPIHFPRQPSCSEFLRHLLSRPLVLNVFFSLSRVHTKVRSSMSQDRVKSLLLLSVQRNIIVSE